MILFCRFASLLRGSEAQVLNFQQEILAPDDFYDPIPTDEPSESSSGGSGSILGGGGGIPDYANQPEPTETERVFEDGADLNLNGPGEEPDVMISDTVTPGDSRSTMNADNPWCRDSGEPVRAMTRQRFAHRDQLVQIL